MFANASRDRDSGEIARAVARLARALCAGDEARARSLASAAAPNGAAADDDRRAAYRSLIQAFLADAAVRSPSPAARERPSEAVRTIEALGRLEPVERAALLLVAVERLSYREAASVLDMTEADLAAALARAREAFAARLAASAAQGRPHLRLVG